MKKLRVLTALCACLLLTGCASLLEREYTVVEPHSSKFWESEAAGTLRAENYQDIVNDLLLLIGQRAEQATIRLYNYDEDLSVGDVVEQAITEIRHETPMGAYAVDYITSSYQNQRGYYEISLQISYRRSAEQVQAVVNATSTEALASLLEAALNNGRSELAVRIGFWRFDDVQRVETIVRAVRESQGIEEDTPWAVLYYPETGAAGLVEFVLEGAERYPEAIVRSVEELQQEEQAEGEENEAVGEVPEHEAAQPTAEIDPLPGDEDLSEIAE